MIYTTNAIESLNSVIRKAIKNRKIFPHDNSALKVTWLAIQAASKKWRACPTKCFGHHATASLECCTESVYAGISRSVAERLLVSDNSSSYTELFTGSKKYSLRPLLPLKMDKKTEGAQQKTIQLSDYCVSN